MIKVLITATILESIEVTEEELQEYNDAVCEGCFNLTDKQEHDACLESYMVDYKEGMEEYCYQFNDFEWEVV